MEEDIGKREREEVTGDTGEYGSERENSIEENSGNECERDELMDTIKRKNTKAVNSHLDGVPVDRGWAWVLLAGCVLYPGIYGGVNRSFGVYFLHYQERFQAKAAEVAIMSLIENLTISIAGLLIMTVVLKKLTCRIVVAIGGGLIAVSYLFTAPTEDIRLFYLLQGFVHGAGISMVRSPTISIIGVYFSKHRGLATSIYTGSASLGGLVFAPVVNALFAKYGYTGTMLITGGLFLNILVSASVMRPPSWFKNRRKKLTRSNRKLIAEETPMLRNKIESDKRVLFIASQNDTLKPRNGINHLSFVQTDNGKATNKPRNTDGGVQSTGKEECVGTSGPRTSVEMVVVNATSVTVQINERDEAHIGAINSSERTNYAIDSIKDMTQESLERHLVTHIECEETKAPYDSRCKNCLSSATTSAPDILKVFDLKMLRNINLILYLSMAFLLISGMVVIPYYLPQFAKDAGLSYDEIAIMISATACTDFISKLVSGIITDRNWLRRSSMLALGAVAVGTLCQLSRFFTNFASVTAMAVSMACFYGWYTAMYSTILIDCVGLQNLQSSLGFVSVVHGISIAVCFPISGLLRDITGSYIYSFHLAGCMCYAGAVILLLMPLVQKKSTTNKATVGEEVKVT